MYSHEDRMRAVELYIKYGHSAADVIRELGYPNRGSLRNWFREFEESGDLHAGKARPRSFSDEQARAAVDHYLEHGKSLARTMRAMGYPKSRATLAAWVDELAPGQRREVRSGGCYAHSYEDKVDAVVALETRDKPAAEVASERGVTRETLYSWKYELLGRKVPCTMPGNDVETEDANALAARVAELEGQVRELELRKAILEGTVALLGKDPGADPNRLTNREKTLLIGSLRPSWPLKDLLAGVGLGKSSYYYQVGAIAAGDRDAELREQVRAVFDASDETYGRRRVHDELAAGGAPAGERRIARIMREERLVARGCKRRRGYSSYKGEISQHPGNKVRRDFRAGLPNFLWLTDVTQFAIPAGKVYLSPVLDCFDGAIVSWTASTSPNAEMANSMLRGALETVPDSQRRFLVLHSDCGCHYRWPEWISICEEAGITRSMSAKGCSPDNSAMEGFFGRMKNEMFYGRDWSGVTIEEFVDLIGKYIERYNTKRIKRSLGGMSPMDYRKSLGLAA